MRSVTSSPSSFLFLSPVTFSFFFRPSFLHPLFAFPLSLAVGLFLFFLFGGLSKKAGLPVCGCGAQSGAPPLQPIGSWELGVVVFKGGLLLGPRV